MATWALPEILGPIKNRESHESFFGVLVASLKDHAWGVTGAADLKTIFSQPKGRILKSDRRDCILRIVLDLSETFDCLL